MPTMATRDIGLTAQGPREVGHRSQQCIEGASESRPPVQASSGSQEDDWLRWTGEALGWPRDTSDIVRESEEARRVVEGLVGRSVPSLLLAATQGEPVDLSSFAGRSAVIYVYPGHESSPDGGEDSPMLDAAQHRSFGAHEHDMAALGLSVVGISSQSSEDQLECAEATRVRHALLSDPHLLLAQKLGLPTFEAHGTRWYRRLTMVVSRGRIGKVFYPVQSPARHPAQIVAWAKVQGP